MENVATDDVLAATDGPKRRFLVGDLVEVRMLEKGLRGSWHPAKVVEVLEGMRMVEYEELLEDDEETKLKELIAVGRASDGNNLMGTLPLKAPPKKSRPVLRPRPPAHPDCQPISWHEGVWVECFYEDAWWEGILAENITTTVSGEDATQVTTRKSEVDVLFPEENDVTKSRVNLMRVGQEWDEQTGNWSLKGCVPIPVLRPNKKRSKKDSRQSQHNYEEQQQQAFDEVTPVRSRKPKAAAAANSMEPKTAEAAVEYELCENPLALSRIMDESCQYEEAVVDTPYNMGYGYQERLRMFQLGYPNVSFEKRIQEPVDACHAVPIEVVDVQSPVDSSVSRATQNEEAAVSFLKSTGWIITTNTHKKTGEVTWKCKFPRVNGAGVQTFPTLLEALSFEAHRGPPGGNVQAFTSLSQAGLADKKDDVDGSSASTATGEDEDDQDEYAVSARQILKRAGWDVFTGLCLGGGGKTAYFYRTPETGSHPSKWFKNWRLAIEEYVKQKKIAPKQEASVPNQKKRGGRGQHSSPMPTPRRVTRKLSMSEDAKSMPDDAKKSADGLGPSFVKSEDVSNSAVPDIILCSRDYSDVDESDTREVNIVVNSGRKRTAGDRGQNFTRSSNIPPASPLMNSYLAKPFGSVSSFTQNDNAYVLHVITHDFLKEQISTTVEKNDMLIKARYVVAERFDNIPVRCNGSMSARVTLPRNVEREKITAELKSPILIFTLPKSLIVPEEAFEINIE